MTGSESFVHKFLSPTVIVSPGVKTFDITSMGGSSFKNQVSQPPGDDATVQGFETKEFSV